MTNFLAQVADLDRRARGAGMPGLLLEGYRITDEGSLMNGWAIVPPEAATAAVTHWLREWLYKHGRNDRGTPEQLIEWATDRITLAEEARHANPA